MGALAARIAAAADSPPEPGDFLELGDALVWVRLPIPGPLHHINVWLLRGRDGWTLVDTGMAIPAVAEAWQALERRLPALEAVERIVVTHHHPDHYGMAARLAAARGVTVLLSDAAYAAATGLGEAAPDFAARLAAFAEALGVEFEAGFFDFLSGRRYRSVISGAPPRRAPLAAGQRLDTLCGAFEISLHHGHAPGHACLHAADSGLLISGDQVLPAISPNISLYPGTEEDDPLGSYLASLEALAALPDDTLVLPAHGRPFTGLGRRLEALRAEHHERLARIVATCRSAASTAEVTGALFRLERLDPLNRLLATTETLAHLRYLERRGRLRAEGKGPALRWCAATPALATARDAAAEGGAIV